LPGSIMSMLLEEALGLRDPTPEAMSACAASLAAQDADPWDVAEIFEKLREWLRRDVDLAQRLLAGARLQTAIVLALRRHVSNLEVARLGCGVVAGCCQKSNQNAGLMQKAGVVQAVFDVMDTHPSDGNAQDNACVALWRISERQGVGAEEIVKKDGIRRLFRSMEDHLANPFVQVNACMAMERLYMRGGASSEGMRVVAEQAMEAHPSNTQIKRGAKRLLDVLNNPVERQPTGASQMQPATTSKKPVVSCTQLAVPLHDWLIELDDVGFLMEYHEGLRRHFDSLAQVIDSYAPAGELDPRFFDDLGVRKLGHRRLFEKWCRDHLWQRKGGTL